jgi:asparagine synthase (glutamine-hydrolysing)
MCGIAGVLATDGGAFTVTPEYVTRMRETLVHRGPDGGETWVSDDGRVGLGFRRLSIVDLSPAAMQPMENEDGSVRLVFNGEIYNHTALRRELEGLGHRFRTDHSDTEAVVHAFEEWGIDCLHRLRGMFALGIWDARERTLWLARDRVGIKPLHWSVYGGRLAFGSEIKALLADPERSRAVDPEALYHYLSFLTAPAPLTLFAGIRKLPAGSWLRATGDGEVRVEEWWDPWDHASPQEGDDEELAGRILETLRESVQLRKMADVPVGIFLSGGIDSSTNAALFAEGERDPVHTFSIGYDADYASYPSELPWARRMAERVGADHHERIVSQQDLLDFLPELVRLQDEPIADPVAVPLFFVSELARRNGVIVCQAGEGADELFWGYPSWRTHLRLQRADDLPVPALVKQGGLAALRAAGQGTSRPYEFLRRGAAGEPVFWGGAEAFTEAQKQRLLGPELRGSLDGLSSWDALAPLRARFERKAWETSHLHWMSYLDLKLRLPELLLARIDRMSMGSSVEVRVPFLDHELVELTLGIPAAAKTRDGELKRLLKLAVAGILPPEFLARPKQGFRVPVDEWVLDRLGERTREEVDAFCRDSGLLDRDEAARVLAGPWRDAWYLLNLALWWRESVA